MRIVDRKTGQVIEQPTDKFMREQLADKIVAMKGLKAA